MGRILSDERRAQIAAARENDLDALGPMLGEFIADNNIPVECVAQLLFASEPTIYRWMYGSNSPSRVFQENIRKLLTIIRKAKRAKDLPLEGTHTERVAAFINVVKIHRPQITRA